MQIREMMTPNPACCTPDASLQEVAKMMERNDCGLIPVVESHASMKPAGTITDRDIAIRAVAAGGDASTMKAADILTSDVATVRPEMSIEECFDVMEDREIRRVLVTDDAGRLCGIVAQADIVQSDASPVRTNKVIREISESAPSRHETSVLHTVTGGFSSVFNGQSLYPFFIGLGSGVGLAFLLNNWRGEAEHEFSGSRRRSYDDIVEAANRESFGKYADAEREIESRRHKMEDRFNSLRSETTDQITDRSDYTTGPGSEDTPGQSRTAGQSG